MAAADLRSGNEEAKGLMGYEIGIDIGGTFTDLVAYDQLSGDIRVAKAFTTPNDRSLGVMNAIKKAGLNLNQVSYFVHGTTAAVNAIVERKGAKAALVTTKGFEDVLEIMRGDREHHYDLQWEKPKPLIPRYLRFGVEERVNYKGQILKPAKIEELDEFIEVIKKEGVDSLAICCLHSFMNDENEKKIKAYLESRLPQVALTVSSELLPEIREYERVSTVAINAYIKPVMVKYMQNLAGQLKRAGMQANLMIMKSNGGVMTAEAVKEVPAFTIGSGPAGGVVGSTLFGDNVITIDMGGTTFDVSLIDAGQPKYTTEKDVIWGFPLRLPQIDIVSIGTGGGSIAWIDKGGLLRVGPQSAGAEPGPICYARGGEEPTFTDACVINGIIDPDYFLGGEVKLDKENAERIVAEKLGKRLGKSVQEVASGIYEIACENMAAAMKLVSVERGFDPRDFAIVAYGGAGPVVATFLARELGAKKVIIPIYPGIFSAVGMLAADVRYDFVQAYPVAIAEADLARMNDILENLEKKGLENLAREGFKERIKIIRSADLRYVGQNFEIQTPVPNGRLDRQSLAQLVNSFHAEHEKWYGHKMLDQPVELVSLRVNALSLKQRPKFSKIPAGTDPKEAYKGTREVLFHGQGGPIATPVYQRERMKAGTAVEGPAIIEEMGSVTVLLKGDRARIDQEGHIIVDIEK